MSNKKTWFHYLPEIGRTMEAKADNLMGRLEAVEHLKAKLQNAEKIYKKSYTELAEEVSRHWTKEEISNAINFHKHKSKQP